MQRSSMFSPWLLAGLTALAAGGACRAEAPAWPQWRGPKRDGLSTETGLLKQWPEGGPKLLWTATGCGKGYSSMAVTTQFIYTAGVSNEQTFVMAFDLDGKPVWRMPNGKPWKAGVAMVWARSYDGSRATPTVDDGLVYHLNELGLLSAFDAVNGKLVWSVDIPQRFEAKCPDYGYSESVLVDGDRLICTPAGAKGFMAALDKKTGSAMWVSPALGDGAGFASPILVEDQSVRQIITMTEEAVVGVNASGGKLLWRYPFTNKRKNNIPTPVYHKGFVFASTGYGAGCVLLKLNYEGDRVTASKVWANAALDNLHGGVLLMGDCIYGAANEKPAWVCLDYATGQTRYRDSSLGMGSLTYADGMLYCLAERGTMALAPCTPEGFRIVGRFEVPKGGDGLFWAHPVVCGRRLYIRHADKLYAYDIRG